MAEHLTNIVVVGFIHADHRILVARRAATKSMWPNRFECIGGHLDPGETLESGLQREIHEEIGCKATVGALVDAFTYEDNEAFKVELSYLCTLEPGEEPKLNPEDHSEFRWLNKDQIEQFEKDDEETAALRKAFKVLEGEQ